MKQKCGKGKLASIIVNLFIHYFNMSIYLITNKKKRKKMLLYLPTFISIIINVFMLFGLNSEIRVSVTIGVVYSTLLFLYFLIYKREKHSILILLSAFAYWLLINFAYHAINSVALFPPSSLLISLVFNLSGAVIIFILALFLARILSISPFSILLMSHTALAASMHFFGLALSYFIGIYIASLIILGFISFMVDPPKNKFEFKSIMLIGIFTYSIFFFNEIAIEANIYSFAFFQNYNLKFYFDSIFAFITSLFLFWSPEILYEGFTEGIIDFATQPQNENVNNMWKSGRGNNLPYRGRPLSVSSPSTPITPLPISEPNFSNKISKIISPPTTPSLWSRISNFIPFYNSFIDQAKTPPSIDSEITSVIVEEKKSVVKASNSILSYSDRVYNKYSKSSVVCPILFNSHSSTMVGKILLLPSFDREYSTSALRPTLGYLLKADFMILDDADVLISKIKTASAENFIYAYTDQRQIPILIGTPGKHPMVIINDGGPYSILLILSSAPNIFQEDSTYNEHFKDVYRGQYGTVKTQEIVNDLPWKKSLPPHTSTALIVREERVSQNMAPTFIIIDKALTRDLQSIGEIKDPLGTEKVQNFAPQIKEQAEILAERSRLSEDSTKIKVLIISKK